MGRVRAERTGRNSPGERCRGLRPEQFQGGVKNNSRVLCLGNCNDGLNGKCHRRRGLWGEEQISSGQAEFGMSTRHGSTEVE